MWATRLPIFARMVNDRAFCFEVGPRRRFDCKGMPGPAVALYVSRMRIHSDIDEKRERLIVTFRGEVTLYDIFEMVSTSGMARMLHFPLLADLWKARLKLDPADLARFQELVRSLALKSRLGNTAVLVMSAEDLALVERLSEPIG